MQIILSNISRPKSFMLTLKGFLFFSRCFFNITDVIKSYCEKQFWKLLHLLTIDTQNINQIIVRIGFCSAAKIASTIKLIENDKRFILSRHRGLSRLQSMPLSSDIYWCIKWIWLVSLLRLRFYIKVSQDLGVKTFQISRPCVRGVQNLDGSKYKRLNNLYLVKLSIRYACAVLMAILFRF